MLVYLITCITGCGKSNGASDTIINLNDYVSLSTSGSNGEGTSRVELNWDALTADFAKKVTINEENTEISADELSFLKGLESIDGTSLYTMFSECVNYHLDKDHELSNGDKVTLIWDCNDDRAEKYYNVVLDHTDMDFTIDGLDEAVGKDDSDESKDNTELTAESSDEYEQTKSSNTADNDSNNQEKNDASLENVIKAYQDYVDAGFYDGFLLAYIDDDDIPELFAQSEIEEHILQYNNGTVIDIGDGLSGTHFFYMPRALNFVDTGTDGETGYITYYSDLSLLSSDMESQYSLESHSDLFHAELDKITAEYEDAGQEKMYSTLEEAYNNLK